MDDNFSTNKICKGENHRLVKRFPICHPHHCNPTTTQGWEPKALCLPVICCLTEGAADNNHQVIIIVSSSISFLPVFSISICLSLNQLILHCRLESREAGAALMGRSGETITRTQQTRLNLREMLESGDIPLERYQRAVGALYSKVNLSKKKRQAVARAGGVEEEEAAARVENGEMDQNTRAVLVSLRQERQIEEAGGGQGQRTGRNTGRGRGAEAVRGGQGGRGRGAEEYDVSVDNIMEEVNDLEISVFERDVDVEDRRRVNLYSTSDSSSNSLPTPDHRARCPHCAKWMQHRSLKQHILRQHPSV